MGAGHCQAPSPSCYKLARVSGIPALQLLHRWMLSTGMGAAKEGGAERRSGSNQASLHLKKRLPFQSPWNNQDGSFQRADVATSSFSPQTLNSAMV